MKAKVYLALVAVVVLAACGIDAFAQEAMVRGEVKKIDDGAGKPVILPSGMMGDRASVFFASPAEMSALIKHQG